MPDLIERTALSEFNLDGKPVRTGQVVTIDRLQLGRLVKAGCVAESDEDNAAAPKAGLPETKWGGGLDFQADVDEAASKAAELIAAHRKSVEDARLAAETAIGEHQARAATASEEADKAIAAQGDRERRAFEAANAAVREHDARADQARKDADDAIAEHRKRVEEAIREAASGDGAGTDETPPASAKGGKPKG